LGRGIVVRRRYPRAEAGRLGGPARNEIVVVNDDAANGRSAHAANGASGIAVLTERIARERTVGTRLPGASTR